MKKKKVTLICSFLLLSASVLGQAAEEPLSVVFRTSATNPSKTKTQSVPIKILLPTEIEKEDILDQGGLTLAYDEAKGIYYLSKEGGVELAPTQTVSFAVKVRDVWFIPQAETTKLKKQIKQVLKQLRKTEHHAKAKEINQRLDEIVALQNDQTISRKEHIISYRINLRAIEKIKENLAQLKLLAKKPKPKKEAPKPPATTSTTAESEKPLGFFERIKRAFNKGG